MTLFTDSLIEALRLVRDGNSYVLSVVLLSLRVSGMAVLLGVLLGLPVGIAVGMGRFRGRALIVALIHTGFALPPVVVGLFVYMMLSRAGPAGQLEMLFTPAAMVVAQAVLAAPYVAGISLAAVQAVPADVRLQARALGASSALALWMHLREARLG
ncbi:MAG: ABC transporter permease, partial [Gemmatimonadota bacterium]